MRKDELFILAMQNGYYRHKEWVISAFAFIADQNHVVEGTDFQIALTGGAWKVFDPSSKQFVEILDHEGKKLPIDKPVYRMNEAVTLPGNSLVNQPKTVETRYGVILANCLLLVYPFKNKIEFINGEMTFNQIEGIIGPLLVDFTDPDFEDPKKIKVEEYKEYVKACSQLEAFCLLCVPTITEKSLTTNPATKKRLEELKLQYKDTLNDPKTIALIDAEVERLDREWIKGDPAERFLISKKSYAVSRKKLLGVYGGEAGLGDGSTMAFIDKPLTDGIEVEKLPEMINSLRSGSYDRGQSTALGGVKVKEMFRAFQNSNITEKDCTSTVGIFRPVRKDNKKAFVGLYRLVNKKPVLVTDENVDELVGKTVEFRTPGTCKTGLTDYCEVCMGVLNSRSKQGLGAAASQIGSMFMGIFMGAMHGKVLAIEKFEIEDVIS